MARRLRLGVLVSGSGSNLQAILDACAARRIPAEVAVVISNVPDAHGLKRARDARVPAISLPHHGFARREDYDARLVSELKAKGVELVCLAGFMRIVTPVLLSAFPQRVINIHPSLLPAFPGMHGVGEAFRAGVRVSGCTVHFVDEGTDTGPILIQAAVPILDGDSEETLAARILEQEHRIYPRAIALIAEGRVQLEGRRVRITGTQPDAKSTLASP
ncbi:MAG TPA: phosphoribosylglycinamide formyltransferase, partial [Myxococcales bacterium]|nr:phosphoribosylglycinamide formyltransferase [Myxococcales bacterium]